LAGFLAPALVKAGYAIEEIVARPQPGSLARARKLARRVGARVVTTKDAIRGAAVLWFCVPDREIRRAAEVVATRVRLTGVRFAFHSSGALASGELDVLRRAGIGTPADDVR
jgi:predicted short-subunit dehydrogenase-like oxidoreductase (DUF2520 family)